MVGPALDQGSHREKSRPARLQRVTTGKHSHFPNTSNKARGGVVQVLKSPMPPMLWVAGSCVFCKDGYDAAHSVRLRRFRMHAYERHLHSSIPIRIGPWFPPLQQMQGWSTLTRGEGKQNQRVGHPATCRCFSSGNGR